MSHRFDPQDAHERAKRRAAILKRAAVRLDKLDAEVETRLYIARVQRDALRHGSINGRRLG